MLKDVIETYLKANTDFDYYSEWEDILNEVVDMCENSDMVRWAIFRDVEKENHRQDLVTELEDRNIYLDDVDIDKLLEIYEDDLGDSEDWHLILNHVIDRYCDEKGDEDVSNR